MSSRCKACNVVLFEEELKTKWPGTQEFTDLCTHCMTIALDPDSVNDSYGEPSTYNEDDWN
jgi:hypothetical protein